MIRLNLAQHPVFAILAVVTLLAAPLTGCAGSTPDAAFSEVDAASYSAGDVLDLVLPGQGELEMLPASTPFYAGTDLTWLPTTCDEPPVPASTVDRRALGYHQYPGTDYIDIVVYAYTFDGDAAAEPFYNEIVQVLETCPGTFPDDEVLVWQPADEATIRTTTLTVDSSAYPYQPLSTAVIHAPATVLVVVDVALSQNLDSPKAFDDMTGLLTANLEAMMAGTLRSRVVPERAADPRTHLVKIFEDMWASEFNFPEADLAHARISGPGDALCGPSLLSPLASGDYVAVAHADLGAPDLIPDSFTPMVFVQLIDVGADGDPTQFATELHLYTVLCALQWPEPGTTESQRLLASGDAVTVMESQGTEPGARLITLAHDSFALSLLAHTEDPNQDATLDQYIQALLDRES